MTSGRAAVVALALCTARAGAAQTTTDSALSARRAFVRDAGPGVAGRLLREVLGAPHMLIVAPDTGLVIERGTEVERTLVVVGGPVRFAAHARGDVVVLGDLVLRPGAVIEGRAMTFGGAIANSTLAVVNGRRVTYDDVGFQATETSPGVLALDHVALERYPVPIVSLPGVIGVRIPTYDRVDGASIAFGPEIALGGGRLRIEPTVTYRSQLGALDPGVTARWEASRRTAVEGSLSRATLTNDAWIRSDLVNTATALFAGSDARNYYRADRAQLTASRLIEGVSSTVTPFLGGVVERARSIAVDSMRASAPWSLLGRDDRVDGIRRPNPGVSGGTIGSVVVGVDFARPTGEVTVDASARIEVPVAAPTGRRFVQGTADARVEFPTFGEQSYSAFAHVVLTTSDYTPSQRYAYVGGGSSIPTLRMLEQGGDRLVWLESRYAIPLSFVRLPFVGSPRATLRHIVGGAGVGRLPALTQNVGIRLAAGGLRFDVVVDPADPKRREISFGVGVR